MRKIKNRIWWWYIRRFGSPHYEVVNFRPWKRGEILHNGGAYWLIVIRDSEQLGPGHYCTQLRRYRKINAGPVKRKPVKS